MLEPDEVPVPERAMLSSGRYIHFGPFRIDQQRQEVSRGGARLKLQGKVYQTLIILLEKSGEVVTREELRLRLWPADTHVNYDANVNTTVNKLRQALGDSSDKPLYVETIPRKGYCLLVQPAVSNVPGNLHASQTGKPVESTEAPVPGASSLKVTRSDLWIVLGAIGLILAGMFLGAGIMRLWINHASSVSPNSLAVVLLRILTKIIL
ncbi:MAG TPA: winged helix-turn-helix domain-containing protein [Candidatus Angelobacter sp.]|nr:winged helix-turn-helix domain-containing protein [Candidatus Angelobacter sp.]